MPNKIILDGPDNENWILPVNEPLKPSVHVINAHDTVSDLIDKLNSNFSIILDMCTPVETDGTGDDGHDALCDTILIKPHQSIHRRVRILEPLENRRDISWLSDVDYIEGDVAIVEQKRIEDTSSTRVFMYTIAKSDGDYGIELIHETELTGIQGKNGEIHLDPESTDMFENIHFGRLTVDTLNVDDIVFVGDKGITVPSVVTNRLTIGDITFESTDDGSVLGTSVMNVGKIYGFRGAASNVTFGSPICVDFVAASKNADSTKFESGITTHTIKGDTIDGDDEISIRIDSVLKSTGDNIVLASPVKVDTISSNGTNISVLSPVIVPELLPYYSDNIRIRGGIMVNRITAPESIVIDSPVTSSGELEIDTVMRIEPENLSFGNFGYNDKFRRAGDIFMGLDSMSMIDRDEMSRTWSITSDDDLSTLGTPYSFIPITGTDNFFIGKITDGDKTRYSLMTEGRRIMSTGQIRIFTTRTDDGPISPDDEGTYEIISTNDEYRDIFDMIVPPEEEDTSVSFTSTTVGFADSTSDFTTHEGCDIEVKRIYHLNNLNNIGGNKVWYYLSLY